MINKEIKCVGIVVKPGNEEALATAQKLPAWLGERGVKLVGEPRQEAEIFDFDSIEVEKFKNNVDLIIVLGGDGTMISTARLTGEREVLVLGVNYGGLGYLTEFRIEELFTAIESILDGNYEIDQRMMLDVELWRGKRKVATGRVLNDVVINKAALARIIEVDVSLNDLYVNSFRADGLIIATPTGSTAYNLSAGGPIIYPSMNAVVITPICPFTLTNRPIVMPDTAEISLSLKNDSDGVFLTLDGQVGYQMEVDDCAKIRKSETNLNLVQPPNRNYFDVLRSKLKWGR